MPARPFALSLVFLVACESPTDGLFERSAVPVLETRCASATCHGVAPDDPWPTDPGFFMAVDEDGRVADIEAARSAATARIVTQAPAELSSLVRIPMDPQKGGGPHFGGAALSGPEDPAVRALVRWIESEPSGGEDVELTPLQARFAETVLPTLIERCGQASCHGPSDGAFAQLAPHVDEPTGLAAPHEIAHVYRSARKHIDLWSDDPLRSRLIRKGIRTVHGGLPHRRSRFGIFPLDGNAPADAPAIRAVLDWIAAERSALEVPARPTPSGLLFVAGPAADRSPFRIEPGPVGSDLYLATWPPTSQSERNLTADLHPDGPVEIRDPAVSHDARRVVFAMREEDSSHFEIWELELATAQARPRTEAGDTGSFVQPIYAPDGSLIAVWDGHGEAGADADGIAPELVRISTTGALERLTYTPAPEVTPSFLASGKTRGQLLFSTRRTGPSGAEGVMFRFPLSHNPDFNADPEYHAHFGASLAPITPLGARDLADGRQVFVGLQHAHVADDRGSLGLLDRSLGPMLAAADKLSASIVDYTAPVTWLEIDRPVRDPYPLPDGRLLVAAANDADPDLDALFTVEFDDQSLASPRIAPLVTWTEKSLRSPIPVVSRPAEVDPQPSVIDSTQPDGYLVFRDAAVLESLYGKTAPVGERIRREDIVGVRVLAWPGLSANALRRHDDGGTTAGLGPRPPMLVLGEWPIHQDRSVWFRVPARRPVTLQWLDADDMAVGDGLDRWYYAEGLESVTGGTNHATYNHACSGCHGATTGWADDEISTPPDAVSSASVTLATHEHRNPRRPSEPIFVGDQPESIDYLHDIGPIFLRACTNDGCHGGSEPAAGLALDEAPGDTRFPAAYTALMERAIDVETLRARRSPLVARLTSTPLETDTAGTCLTAPLDVEQLQSIVRWIESGAAYDLRSMLPTGDSHARRERDSQR